MRQILLVLSVVLWSGIIATAPAVNGSRVNGVGVFTQWFSPFDVNDVWSANRCPRGQIVKANIVDNVATSWDTLYDSLGQYPAINANCSLVVFFRWSQNITVDRSTGRVSPATTPANKPSYLSIVNLRGTPVVRNLIQVNMQINTANHSGENNQLLDWPAGDWIYYEKPTYSNEVRRINYKTLQDEFVCTWGEIARRFSLSLDGTVAGNQGGACGNCAYQFPPTTPFKSVGAPGCNMVVSASGGILAHYFGGCHDDIDIVPFAQFNWATPNPWLMPYMVWINQIETWLGKQVSYNNCADLNRWSVNSDKWMIRQIGWNGQGQDIAKGANQVIVNYIDDKAIIGNPYLPPANGPTLPPPSPRNQWVNADAGDFYVTGDATNPNSVYSNSWEDTLGVWHQLPGLPHVLYSDATSALPGSRKAEGVALRTGELSGVMYDASGRLVGTASRTVPGTSSARGVYVVKSEGSGVIARRILGCR